ncbi:MAG: hypothetical protein LW704_07950 [Cryomorphaceae bacterium]|nr:hypothetical protein [Cryomorphaceae bacterium]
MYPDIDLFTDEKERGVLSTKELIAGTLDPFLVALSFVVMTALAVLAVFISYRRFDKESNVVI